MRYDFRGEQGTIDTLALCTSYHRVNVMLDSRQLAVNNIIFGYMQFKHQQSDRSILPQLWRLTAVHIAIVISLLCTAAGATAATDANVWRALRSGEHIALMRHAIAPGTGDPAEFALGDCSTQRNLSAKGRAQAARIGARFRANGIQTATVFTSQWCRCLDTARLLELGPVQEQPVLNSFFRDFDRRERQTQALKAWLASQDLNKPLVLVTHQVNITALTNVYPASGELVIIRRSNAGEISVIGTIETD